MAEWNINPQWTPQEQINGGKQFTPDDTLSAEDINALVENMQYLYMNEGDFDVSNFPIGAIFMTTSTTSPAALFGGDWTKIENRFLVGAGSSFAANSQGGASSQKLGIKHMPDSVMAAQRNNNASAVYVSGSAWANTSVASGSYYATNRQGRISLGSTDDTSSQTEVPIIPPYYAVHIWRRIG